MDSDTGKDWRMKNELETKNETRIRNKRNNMFFKYSPRCAKRGEYNNEIYTSESSVRRNGKSHSAR